MVFMKIIINYRDFYVFQPKEKNQNSFCKWERRVTWEEGEKQCPEKKEGMQWIKLNKAFCIPKDLHTKLIRLPLWFKAQRQKRQSLVFQED